MISEPKEKFLFHLPRHDIEDCICTRVLQTFPFEEMSAGILRRMEGAVAFIVTGYDEDKRELFTIPEVRTFLTILHKESNGGLVFLSELTTTFVATLALCQFDLIEAHKRPLTERFHLPYRPEDFVPFIQTSTQAIRRLGRAAGLRDAQIARKETQFRSYMEDHWGTILNSSLMSRGNAPMGPDCSAASFRP